MILKRWGLRITPTHTENFTVTFITPQEGSSER